MSSLKAATRDGRNTKRVYHTYGLNNATMDYCEADCSTTGSHDSPYCDAALGVEVNPPYGPTGGTPSSNIP